MDSTQLAPTAATVDVASARPHPLGTVESLLSVDELGRAATFRHTAERVRFGTARALLRLVVSRAIGTIPADIVFDSRCRTCGRPHGKPRPVLPAGAAPVFTSVTHAANRILVAISPVAVGVDVETQAAVAFAGFDVLALSAAERAHLATLPVTERDRARADAWVQKEAVLKLHEVGLGRDPHELQLGLSSAERVVPDLMHPGQAVALVPLPVGGQYRAALAVAGAIIPAVRLVNGNRLLAEAAPPARSATCSAGRAPAVRR